MKDKGRYIANEEHVEGAGPANLCTQIGHRTQQVKSGHF